ncbi:TPA: hypothetical protein N0F65_005019 [Lagenidium giganteum]|uniref:Retrotransposon gag domain-containing protein n=1 Tax=Lagenidium giganteum TaxID=4803 RepID=A0AAV2ZI33_9STRA|nr:TPA: hypothetical protein N0F65_005019 [Lagenidium giganteum]
MGNHDEEHFDEALTRATALYFPRRPVSKIRQYLRETPKPADMSIEAYVARLHQINDLIRFLPAPNNPFSDAELRDIVEGNVPLEESEVSNRQPPYQRKAPKEQPRNGSGQPKGNTPNGPPSKKNKKLEPPQKWCEHLKLRTNDTAECRAKNKSEESNFIDLEVTETCYLVTNEPTPKPQTTATTELLVALPMPSGKQRMVRALADFGSSRSLCDYAVVPEPSVTTKFPT